MKLSIFFSTIVMSLAFSCGYASAANLGAPATEDSEQALVITDLTAGMFKSWTSGGAGASVKGEAENICAYVLNESTGMPYGDGNVHYLNYADLSEYEKLEVTATAGEPRIMFNRVEDNGYVQVEVPRDASTFETVVDNGDGSKTYSVDIAAIVMRDGFAHLHAIKGANWANTTVTSMKLYASANSSGFTPLPFNSAGLLSIPMSQSPDVSDGANRAVKEEGKGYTKYTSGADISVIIKMMEVDVLNCDYVLIKFAAPTPAGVCVSFWEGQKNVQIPEGSTEYKYVLADDNFEGSKLPQIALITINNPGKEVYLTGVYKHINAVLPDGAVDAKDLKGTNGNWANTVKYPMTFAVQGASFGDGDGSNEATHVDVSKYEKLTFVVSNSSEKAGGLALRVWMWDDRNRQVVTLYPHPESEYESVKDWKAEYAITAPGNYVVNLSDYKYLKGIKAANNWGGPDPVEVALAYLTPRDGELEPRPELDLPFEWTPTLVNNGTMAVADDLSSFVGKGEGVTVNINNKILEVTSGPKVENTYDSQFFIVSNVPFYEGDTVSLSMYIWAKSEADVEVQAHGIPDGNHYNYYSLVGSATPHFTVARPTKPYTYEGVVTREQAGADGMLSIALNLNVDPEPNTYYFKNIVLKKKVRKGDVNYDSKIDISDVSVLVKNVMTESKDMIGDVEGDKAINIKDVNKLVDVILRKQTEK